MSYLDFIATKRVSVAAVGFDSGPFTAPLFPFQARNVTWACRMGRCALFLDTGLGKTVQQLEWAHQVANHTGGRVIVLAPLAVAQQTVREAAKFGIPGVVYAREPEDIGDARIVVTNYERLAKFDPSGYIGVVLDEASILKSYSGSTRTALQSAFERTPYRLSCSATPSPNDHLELGTQAEFLGVMSSHEMIARWFINDTNSFGTYRLKGHAVQDYWDWVGSWAVMASKPSDLGDYSDEGYVLPPLDVQTHVVRAPDDTGPRDDGNLFRIVELNATAVHGERRRSISVRAALAAAIIRSEPGESWIVWCETDYEADELLAQLDDVSGLAEVRGSDKPADKEARLVGFVDGTVRVLVTKPKIAGFGLNWQHCARVLFVGATFSFESWYQAIRRSWRFGQRRRVVVHAIMADTERPVWAVLERKRDEFEAMQSAMVAAALRNRQQVAKPGDYKPTIALTLPEWLR